MRITFDNGYLGSVCVLSVMVIIIMNFYVGSRALKRGDCSYYEVVENIMSCLRQGSYVSMFHSYQIMYGDIRTKLMTIRSYGV